jgi:hypothetical protein
MNFMKQRGGPQAIEILTEGRREPTILMFYPLRKEVYIADRSVEKQSYQWVVRGPFAIERQDYRELQGLGIGFAGEPLFFIQGRSQRFGAQPIVDNDRALLPIVPTPRPTPTRKPQRSKPIVYSTPTPTPFAPMNSDQKAIQAAQGFAERAENGDLVHTVVKDGEKLEAIALWYTGSKAKVTDLEKRNSISKDAPLALGSRIVVPLAIVRQFKIMTTP